MAHQLVNPGRQSVAHGGLDDRDVPCPSSLKTCHGKEEKSLWS